MAARWVARPSTLSCLGAAGAAGQQQHAASTQRKLGCVLVGTRRWGSSRWCSGHRIRGTEPKRSVVLKASWAPETPVTPQLGWRSSGGAERDAVVAAAGSRSDHETDPDSSDEGRPAENRSLSLPSHTSGREFLQQSMHFVNLTNGIEAIPALNELGLPYTFIRIQSTACEQQNFEQIVQGLDSHFLLHLALGYNCVVYDYGSRNKKRGVPRALWYGLEFIRFALNYVWFQQETEAVLRGHNVSRDFKNQCNNLSKGSKRKLKYFRQYIPNDLDRVRLLGVYGPTEHDPDNAFYIQHLHNHHQALADRSVKAWEANTASSSGDIVQVLSVYDLKVFFRGISHGEWRQMEEKAKAEGVEISIFDSATQLASYGEQQQNAR